MKTSKIKDNLNRKVVVIGLDGATFDVMTPMIASGRLPNLSRLIANGSHGRLLSTMPPLSPVAWTSLFTGRSPGNHGILDFLKRKPNSYEVEIFNATWRRARPIWQCLNRSGKVVGIINVPMTYPPDAVHGFMISGMDSPKDESNFMYPHFLSEELKKAIGGYELENIDFRSMVKKPEDLIKKLYRILENHFDAAEYLMETYPCDFFFVVFEAIDRAQHNFWKYMIKNSKEINVSEKYHGLIYDIYENVDEKIGMLLKKLGPEDTVLVVSDHGFISVQRGVRLNLWLADQSYLAFRKRLPGYKRLKRIIGRSTIRGLKRFLPEQITKMIKREGQEKGLGSRSFSVLPNIDMTRTKAFCLSSYGIYLNLRGREPSGIVEPGVEYESLRQDIMSDLMELTDPLTGEKVIEKVLKREDVIHGEFASTAPDIYISWNKGYFFMGERQKNILNIKDNDKAIFTHHNWSGQHGPEGIFIIQGPYIKKSHMISGTKIIDVAPTIMYLMGLDIPREMDGKVLINAIDEDYLRSTPITYTESPYDDSLSEGLSEVYSKEDADIVRKRLKDLGYID